MVSELQRRKTAVVFNAMDDDSDGYLDRADFASLSARWTENRGLATGSPEADRLTAIMMGWWETLLAASDVDRDDRVTLDEVLRVVERLSDDTAPVVATAAAMFEAVDEDGDGRVSAGEYRQLIETWNGTSTDTDEIFHLLDGDGDGYVSRSEFLLLWTEFWAGDNPRRPARSRSGGSSPPPE
jgi:Ca2+-binding EF-hand superfamily protein